MVRSSIITALVFLLSAPPFLSAQELESSPTAGDAQTQTDAERDPELILSEEIDLESDLDSDFELPHSIEPRLAPAIDAPMESDEANETTPTGPADAAVDRQQEQSSEPFQPTRTAPQSIFSSPPTPHALNSAQQVAPIPAQLPQTPAAHPFQPATTRIPRTEAITAPAIQTRIIAPEYINVGQIARLHIDVQNVGQVVVDQIELVAQLPESAKFESSEPQPTRVDGQEYVFHLNDILVRQNRSITFNVVPTTKQPLNITTRVRMLSHNSVAVGVRQPVLDVRYDGPGVVQTGREIKHQFTILNTGDGIANDLFLRAQLPEQMSEIGTQNRVFVRRLEPGQSVVMEYTALARTAGQTEIHYTIESKGAEPQTVNTPVRILKPELHFSAKGPRTNYVSQSGIYQLVVENTGEVAVTGVAVALKVPTGIRVDTISRQAKIDSRAGTLTWTFNSIKPGAKEIIQLQAAGIAAGPQVFQCQVSCKETASRQFQVATQIITRPDISQRIYDSGHPVPIGGQAQFTVDLQNQGSSEASGVQVEIELPTGIQAVAGDDYFVNELDNRIVFNPISIEPQGQRKLTFRVACQTAGEHVVRSTIRFSGSSQATSAEDVLYVFETDQSRVSESLSPEIRR